MREKRREKEKEKKESGVVLALPPGLDKLDRRQQSWTKAETARYARPPGARILEHCRLQLAARPTASSSLLQVGGKNPKTHDDACKI